MRTGFDGQACPELVEGLCADAASGASAKANDTAVMLSIAFMISSMGTVNRDS
jgi:hypothetical protein